MSHVTSVYQLKFINAVAAEAEAVIQEKKHGYDKQQAKRTA